MKNSSRCAVTFLAILPVILGAGCASQEDVDALQSQVSRLSSSVDSLRADMVAQQGREPAKYTLEFGFNKSRVNLAMGSKLDNILRDWNGKAVQYEIIGYTDMVGTQKANVMLSEKRAEAVRDALVQRGVEPTMISAKGVGETAPWVQTKDGTRLRANRRAVVTILAK